MVSISNKIELLTAEKLRDKFLPIKHIFSAGDYTAAHITLPLKKNAEFVLVEMITRGNQDGFELAKILQNISHFSHPYLYSIKAFAHDLRIEGKIKQTWTSWLLYEPYNFTMEEYINKKKQSHNPYLGVLKGSRLSEATISNFLSEIVSLCALLEEKGESFKPIHPQNFLYSVQDNIFKFNALNLGKFKSLRYEIEQTFSEFRAPEEKDSSKLEKISSKARVYHIGMLIVYLASLESIEGFNQDKIKVEAKISELSHEYSNFVIITLRKMLIFKEEERMDLQQLNNFIKNKDFLHNNDKKHNESMSNHNTSIEYETQPKHGKSVSFSPQKSPQESPSKPKLVKEEELEGRPQLIIDYERAEPVYKMLHVFQEETKKLAVVALKYLATLFLDIIPLDIPFTIPKRHTSVFAENDKFYMIGGILESQQTSNCYSFKFGQETLTAEKPFKELMRLDPGVVDMGNCIFVMGGTLLTESTGKSQEIPLQTCEIFNKGTEEWRDMAMMNFACAGATYCSYKKQFIYKIGGRDTNGDMSRYIEKYSLATNQWILLGAIRTPEPTIGKGTLGLQVNMDEIFIFGNCHERNVSKQTYTLNLNHQNQDAEYITYGNKHCPLKFSFQDLLQNQCVVYKNNIVYLSLTSTGFRVCSFDGLKWKELKHFNKEHFA